MARAKGKRGNKSAAKIQDKGSSAQAGPSNRPDAASLVEKAHILLAQSNFDLAVKFLTRALEIEPTNLEARELIGVAELEGGDQDVGRQHLLQLFPPHTSEAPAGPSPYLYLAQCAESPEEALGYYSTAAAMLEKEIAEMGRNKAAAEDAEEAETVEAEAKTMAVSALVAMVEIWMSDLCFEAEAEANCESLISRALSISPEDVDARITLASIRTSQQKAEEAKQIALSLFEEIDEKEPFDKTMPSLPTRLTLTRQLLEHGLALQALSLITTAREEDSLEVESAYLEGLAWKLRAEAVEQDPSLVTPAVEDEDENNSETVPAKECYEESMRALVECAKLFAEQDYPDQGIGEHVKQLLGELEAKGVQPALIEESENKEGDSGEWEDVDMSE